MLKFSTNLPSLREEKVNLVIHDGWTTLMYVDPTLKYRVPYIHVEGTNVLLKSTYLNMNFVSAHESTEGSCCSCYKETIFTPVNRFKHPVYINGSECCDVTKHKSEVKYEPLTISETHQVMIKTANLGKIGSTPIYFRTVVQLLDGDCMDVYYYVEGKKHLSLTIDDHSYISRIVSEEIHNILHDQSDDVLEGL